MKLSHESEGGRLLVRVPGPALREGLAGEFRDALIALMPERFTELVLDLSAVRELDSAALAALVSALKGARRRGGTIALRDPQPAVREVLELTLLHRILPILETTPA